MLRAPEYVRLKVFCCGFKGPGTFNGPPAVALKLFRNSWA